MNAIPLLQVDAFTDRAFGGNPAAVCWLEQPRAAEWMQQVAAEMNLSETAFVEPHPQGFGLRWFTPTVEVELCGHATLASAHALEVWGRLAPGQAARFLTRSGWLGAQRQGEWIELDFPARATEAAAMPPGLEQALGGVAASFCGRGPGPLGVNYLLELGSEAEVRAVRPDFAALARLPLRSLSIASAGTAPYDFVSRFFAPGGGVNEDPVTGSAHTQLAPYWGKKLGKSEMLAYQASARGGRLRLRLAGERVLLGGQAVTVLRGELLA
ncbi:MAG TPA: PhzF family phenazine biosynthesis protein [Terriglobales bacterium]|nr:PhzF family phenazine biosynthesis protein [Terriglobales bacterium]